MPEFTSHTPGTFSWPELATTDQQKGVAFYRALFGWGLNDIPMGPAGSYSMLLLDGKEIGAAAALRDEDKQHGVPPHWNLYVTVKSVDESAKRVAELGGTVLAPPFDVMEAGRMAVIQDPTGAALCIWEPKGSIGARILNEPGALCWSELTTRNPDAAEKFYTQLFGWTAKHSAPGSPMAYTEFTNQGKPGIGMMETPKEMPKEIPSYWMPYFQVADCDASTKKAKDLGANLMVGPHHIPGTGWFSIFTDPQGATFAIFTYDQKKP
jgi:predicted enzyme related to lactoylglutathione lyase